MKTNSVASTRTLVKNVKAAISGKPLVKTKKAEPKEIERDGLVLRYETYKGSPMFAIHDADKLANGEEYTLVVGFGARKARALANFLSELEAFAEANPAKE